MSNTLEYYNNNADSFAAGTKDVDFSEIQNLFLYYLKEGARILDFGCGAGRDAKRFYEKGYAVDAVDGFEYGLDPEDFDTLEEYEEALKEAKKEWDFD